MCYIQCYKPDTVFFTSGGSVNDVLVKLSLVAQIVKDASLMCISLGIVNQFDQFVYIPT